MFKRTASSILAASLIGSLLVGFGNVDDDTNQKQNKSQELQEDFEESSEEIGLSDLQKFADLSESTRISIAENIFVASDAMISFLKDVETFEGFQEIKSKHFAETEKHINILKEMETTGEATEYRDSWVAIYEQLIETEKDFVASVNQDKSLDWNQIHETFNQSHKVSEELQLLKEKFKL